MHTQKILPAGVAKGAWLHKLIRLYKINYFYSVCLANQNACYEKNNYESLHLNAYKYYINFI